MKGAPPNGVSFTALHPTGTPGVPHLFAAKTPFLPPATFYTIEGCGVDDVILQGSKNTPYTLHGSGVAYVTLKS